ncbi:MAG: sigma-70 family RNA polymerase sigma factor [Caldimonas sp.]
MLWERVTDKRVWTMSDVSIDRDHAARRRQLDADAAARELDCLRRVGKGDRASLNHLYLDYHRRLAHFLGRYTRRIDLIDEIINETLWIVWNGACEFRGDSKVSTWIFGIAYRCLMKALRDGPAPPASSEPDPRDVVSENVMFDTGESAQRELRDWLDHGLKLLPVEQRMTIELAYYVGQSCEEIATIMSCAVGTVKARMFHARLRLRNTLPALGGDTPTNTHSAQA